jgi:high affinity sulfate transporter 1
MDEKDTVGQNRLRHLVQAALSQCPGLQVLRHYQPGWLRFDIVAGLSVCAILVPQGMAYGSLAGVQPVNGLYAALAAMVAYAIFATSKHVMVGPEASTAVIAAGIIAPLAALEPGRFAVLLAALALLTGLILVLAGIIKLGFIADFLSKPVLVGYLNGVALIVIAGQSGKLLGIKIESDLFFPQIREVISRLGETNLLALGLGAAFIGLLFLMKYKFPRVPASLVVFVVSIIITSSFRLDLQGLSILGDIPAGLPAFQLPQMSMNDLQLLIPGALSLAVLILSDGLLTAQVFAAKHKYQLDANREIIAFGFNNIAASLFQGFPAGSSQSRTAVNDGAHARTQASALVAVVFLVIVLLWLTPLLHFVPDVALGAIIISAASSLVNFKAIGELHAVRPAYATLALITTLGVLSVGLLPGISIAVVFSLLYLVAQITRPHDAVLGRVEGLDGYHDILANEVCETVPGLLIYRFEAQLMFANAGYFRSRLQDLLDAGKGTIRGIVVDAESISSVDITAADMLKLLCADLKERGIGLSVARANASVRAFLSATGVTHLIGERFFPSVRTAVEAFTAGDQNGTASNTA